MDVSDLRTQWSEVEREFFRPPERITVTEWACKYRELGKLSAVTGLYPIELTPFFRPVMDRCADYRVDQQVLCAPAQIGKTVAVVENIVGYYLHQDPSSVMVVLADEATAKFVSTEKIAPMFKDSPHLSHLYIKNTFTTTIIDTPDGGHVDFAWASSVAKLASRPERIVIGDEVNKPGYNTVTEEANSLSLMKERTASYPTGYYKHIFLSTPTIEEGNITWLMDTSDIIMDWQVPCPYCGVYQPLRWSEEYAHGFSEGKYRDDTGKYRKFGRVVWDGGRNADKEQIKATARYKCGSCGKLWTNLEKNDAVSAGKEVPRTQMDGSERKYANHINRIYSKMDSGNLAKLVDEWVSIFKLPREKQIKALQGFINSTLAEPFSTVKKLQSQSEVSILKAQTALNRQTVPEDAVALVCGIDCQKYDFWYVVRAFAVDFTSWLIDYGRLSSWGDVYDLLFNTRYIQAGTGNDMGIWRSAIDTGGGEGRYENVSMTEAAYLWLRKHQRGYGGRVWGTKGSPKEFPGAELLRVGKAFDKTPSGKMLKGGLQLIHLDTFKLKTMFHVRLQNAIDGSSDRPAYLHKDIKKEYIQQITAEKLRVNVKGEEEWAQIGSRANHLFDCEVQCIALADPEWPGGGVNTVRRKVIREQPEQAKTQKGSGFLPKKTGWLR